jgi:hypothetical protein
MQISLGANNIGRNAPVGAFYERRELHYCSAKCGIGDRFALALLEGAAPSDDETEKVAA